MFKRVVAALLMATMLLSCFGTFATEVQSSVSDVNVIEEPEAPVDENSLSIEDEEEVYKVELLNAEPLGTDSPAGDGVTWTVLNGMLIVTGTGEGVINDFAEGEAPWYQYNEGINFVYISGISVIGSYAFYGLDKVASIYLTDSVLDINDGAFEKCSSLTAFEMPKNLRKIGNKAFKGCRKIGKIRIHKNVKKIGKDAFIDCDDMSDIEIEDNDEYVNVDGVIFTKDKKELVVYPPKREGSSYSVPDTVETICDYAFENAIQLESIKLNTNLKKIGDGAFYNCSGLTEMEIPKNVAEIGRNAFQGCSSLEKFTVKSGNSSFKGVSGVLRSTEGELVRYPSNRTNTSYKIPSTISVIKEGAFEGVVNLTEIEFHKDIDVVEDYAFDNALSIKKVKYPGSLQQWGLVEVGLFNGGITEAEWEYGETVNSYTIMIGDTYDLMDYLDDDQKKQLEGAEEIQVTASVPRIVAVDVENTTITAAAVGETLITASAKVDAAIKKVSVLIKVTDNKDAAGLNLEFIIGDPSVDLKDMAEIEGFNSFWDRFIWISTDPHIATVKNGVVTPVSEGETTILAKLQDDKKAISCHVVVSEPKIDYTQYFDFDAATGTITRYKGGLDDDLVIPDEIDDVPVKAIGNSAFANTDVKKVTVSKGVKTIGQMAFYSAVKLKSIKLPKGLEAIGNRAFAYCSSLDNITIPSTVSVEKSGSNWIAGSGVKGIVLEKGMEYMGDWFKDSYIKSVTLPSTLKEIPASAFYYCSDLKTVNIPASVTSIGEYAFYNCRSINKLDLNKTQRVGSYAFAYNTSLNNLSLGSALTVVDSYAFSCDSSLTKVDIPSNLKNVGTAMFYNCYNLSDVTFSNGIENIGAHAFDYCDIRSLTLPSSVKNIGSHAFEGNYYMRSVSLGDGITAIDNYAFMDCASLTSFVIPNSVKTVGNGVFSGCSSLEEITIGSGISDITKNLFAGCDSIKKVVLSSGITRIGDSAFRSCKSIEEISIPYSVRYIGSYAFAYCDGLKSIHIPSGVTYLGNYAFYNCENLESASINMNGELGVRAFSHCYALEDLHIGNNVTYMYEYCFYNCRSLRNVDIEEGRLRTIGSYAFAYCYDLAEIEFPDTLNYINSYAFVYCTSLKDIKFNDNVYGSGLRSIGSYAFDGCNMIEKLYLPDCLQTIGSGAFYGCTKLNYVDLPYYLSSIGSYAFYNCYKIKSVTFPDSLKRIDTYGFAYCSELETVNNLTPKINVGYNAFVGCKFMNVTILDKTATSYKALDQDIAGYIPLELNYKINNDVKVSDVEIKIDLPETVSILSGSFKINGEPSSDFVEKDASYGTYLTVQVTDKEGKISFMIKPEEWDSISSTAHITYTAYGLTKTVLIGTVNCSLPEITISSVDTTSNTEVIVEGMTQRYNDIELYVNDVLQKSITSNYSGTYKTTVTLDNPENHKIYTIKAVVNNGEATTVVKYEEDAPNLESLVMYYGKNGYVPAKYNLTASQRLNLTWGDYWYGRGRGYSYRFEVELSNADVVDKVYVVSVRNNEKEYLEAKWNGTHYVTSGYFKNDCEYVIGTLSVEYTKKQKAVEIMDPSDTMAFFDVNSSDLSPAVNEFSGSIYSASILVGESLKEALGDNITVDVTTDPIEITQDITDKLAAMSYSNDITVYGVDYTLAIDDSIPDTFRIYLLNKYDNIAIVYNFRFTQTDEEGFVDTLMIEDVMNAVEGLASKYESVFGIDIDKEKLETDSAMLGLNAEQQTKVDSMYEELLVERRAFVLSSLVLSASAVGLVSADRIALYLLALDMDEDLGYFRDLKLANIYKLSSDYSIRWYIDPSGYVYEGVKGNRLEGVTATIYYKGEDGEPVLWIDDVTGQPNPVSTDEFGKYKWDVTEGDWQIKFEKEGYKTYVTDWMPVPPPQTEVNVELEPDVTEVSAPEVKITTDEIVITYKDYMNPASVISKINIEGMTTDDYNVSYNEGSENLAEEFNNKDIAGNEYAKVFTLTFNEKLLAGDSLNVSIGSAESHIAGVSSVAYNETLQTQAPEIKEVTLMNKSLDPSDDNVLLLDYRNNSGTVIDFCEIMVAVYDDNDCLMELIPLEIENFKAYENAQTLRVDLTDGYKYVKLFVWDTSNKPLGRVETFGL